MEVGASEDDGPDEGEDAFVGDDERGGGKAERETLERDGDAVGQGLSTSDGVGQETEGRAVAVAGGEDKEEDEQAGEGDGLFGNYGVVVGDVVFIERQTDDGNESGEGGEPSATAAVGIVAKDQNEGGKHEGDTEELEPCNVITKGDVYDQQQGDGNEAEESDSGAIGADGGLGHEVRNESFDDDAGNERGERGGAKTKIGTKGQSGKSKDETPSETEKGNIVDVLTALADEALAKGTGDFDGEGTGEQEEDGKHKYYYRGAGRD